jgi:hypothetical protein
MICGFDENKATSREFSTHEYHQLDRFSNENETARKAPGAIIYSYYLYPSNSMDQRKLWIY